LPSASLDSAPGEGNYLQGEIAVLRRRWLMLKILLYSGTETVLFQIPPTLRRRRHRLTDQPASLASLLSSIAAILNAVAWPVVAAWFLFTNRSGTSHLLKILGNKLSSARKFKVGQFELEAFADELKESVSDAGEQVGDTDKPKAVPKEQLEAAISLKEKVRSARLPESSIREAVKRQIYDLAREYENIRAQLPSGLVRTRKMEQIAAGMRTLALAGLPLLSLLTRSDSVGRRLAAICMLQIEPRQSYFRWLIERFKTENQPFIFYQSAVAIREYVSKNDGVFPNGKEIQSAIYDSIRAISAFKDGEPDQNTLDALAEAHSLVR
jgi:hypothetical protein